jgi:hypothetical protein
MSQMVRASYGYNSAWRLSLNVDAAFATHLDFLASSCPDPTNHKGGLRLAISPKPLPKMAYRMKG